MKVVAKEVGQRPAVVDIPDQNNLNSMQRLVGGGLIEVLHWTGDLVLVFNEEALYKFRDKPNLRFENAKHINMVDSSIFGPVFVTAQSKGDFRSLTPQEIIKAEALLEEYGISYRTKV